MAKKFDIDSMSDDDLDFIEERVEAELNRRLNAVTYKLIDEVFSAERLTAYGKISALDRIREVAEQGFKI